MERKERRHHTREFKLEAVRLAAVGDKTKAKVARELGVRVNQLRQWRLDFEEEERNGVPKQELASHAIWRWTTNRRHVVGNGGRQSHSATQRSCVGSVVRRSPLEASSGKTTRHRLNREGDRTANNALCTISMVRMRSDPRTRAYVARRTAEGLSTKEIQRCLKRYIVRELYPLILEDLADSVRNA